MGKIGDIPGAQRLVEQAGVLKERADELQKRLRGLEALERRVDALERKVHELSKPACASQAADGRREEGLHRQAEAEVLLGRDTQA